VIAPDDFSFRIMTRVSQSKAGPADHRPVLSFTDRSAWTQWLESNHASSPGVWLRLAKKGAGQASISCDEAVEVALCYGWIDGQARRESDEYWLQKYTPRGKRSIWSKRNREKPLPLIARGEMQPPAWPRSSALKTMGAGTPLTTHRPVSWFPAICRQPGPQSAGEGIF
jgi:uncharacterized protein YdeI (YjbR/CyaY-like superfamily)